MSEVNIDANEVLSVIQQRFPREYEICVQQVYISQLEQKVDSPESNSESDSVIEVDSWLSKW